VAFLVDELRKTTENALNFFQSEADKQISYIWNQIKKYMNDEAKKGKKECSYKLCKIYKEPVNDIINNNIKLRLKSEGIEVIIEDNLFYMKW
jgi:hypothetical protein